MKRRAFFKLALGAVAAVATGISCLRRSEWTQFDLTGYERVADNYPLRFLSITDFQNHMAGTPRNVPQFERVSSDRGYLMRQNPAYYASPFEIVILRKPRSTKCLVTLETVRSGG